MRLKTAFIAPLAFALAAAFAWLAAVWAVTLIESSSLRAVSRALSEGGSAWAKVEVDGLQVHLSGTAPSEAERFRALSLAGGIVDSARVIDQMTVAPGVVLADPHYSIEVLRNEDGISLIGLVPAATDRAAIRTSIEASAAGARVTDMLETADHAVPEGWERAVSFGIAALQTLPRAKISIAADQVAITAIADSAAEKRRMEAALDSARPEGLNVSTEISAPRPVITPFTLRFLVDAEGARFDACSADSEAARDRILAAARAAGMTGTGDCVIGLGVPTPNWAEGVAIAIAGLAELGGGALTFSDADVSLVAGPKVDQATFDRVTGDLEAKLPDVFSLSAVMPEKQAGSSPDQGPAEFTANLAEDGRLELRGRLPDELVRSAVDSYARARFGADQVYTATRTDPDLPAGWPVRALTALEALAELEHGSVKVKADTLSILGVTGNPQGAAAVARILSDKLGTGQDFTIAVSYDKALDPNAGLPTPAECTAEIEASLTRHKITFAPGNAQIEPESDPTLDAIARTLKRCGALPMEIGGHTDAQGRDSMNLSLSRDRAEAVRTALASRGVLVDALTAQGYGETLPIADNKTEEGREANRRIEFRLLLSGAEAARIAAATVAADAAAANPDPTRAAEPLPAAEAVQPGAQPAEPTEPQVIVRPAEQFQTRPKARPADLKVPENRTDSTTAPAASAETAPKPDAPSLSDRPPSPTITPELGAAPQD